MKDLSKSQKEILWSIADRPGACSIQSLLCKRIENELCNNVNFYNKLENELYNDINFLMSINMIERTYKQYYSKNVIAEYIRLLPNGMIYLCIETSFVDLSEWEALVNERLCKSQILRINKEIVLYESICMKLMNNKIEMNAKINQLSN